MTSSPRETDLCHYHYDPLDRLISHALADTPRRQSFYCKSRLATEIQGAMCLSIVQQGDQLLAQQQSEGNAPDTTLLATDQQRSVLQMVKANHSPQPIAYSPYGHRSAGGGLLSLLCFNGERPDPVTGHYLLGNGYRAFNPVLMRFNSPDNWSPFGKGGLNAYAYCLGDPANRTDNDGHRSWLTLLKTTVTRKVKYNNTKWKIKSRKTPNEALNARDELIQYDKLIAKEPDALDMQNKQFQIDYENLDKNPTNPTTIAMRDLLEQLNRTPPPSEPNLLHMKLAIANLDPSTMPNIHPDIIRTYAEKVLNIRNPALDWYKIQREVILTNHFKPIKKPEFAETHCLTLK
ncbi:RHS repeat-associated core domain protein-containing protein [Pseudomonas sp. GM78]|uniref:RHS repeat-associated core domain-containing protein n=1 Tax=Pseudomonas sp. GM78 TaxID=1144337 RepID=UPI00026FA02F|nr:RHS repeat-associated core domain-containing protein [Pseudomonas sp. GM78]EJN33569.1 RHS repeat-associated core domain protein-containing protein [Pseudomonas sp. GM78]